MPFHMRRLQKGEEALLRHCLYKAIFVPEGSEPPAEDICDRMIQAMTDLQFTGLTGAMTWSANGEVDKVPTAMIIKDGVYVGLDN